MKDLKKLLADKVQKTKKMLALRKKEEAIKLLKPQRRPLKPSSVSSNTKG